MGCKVPLKLKPNSLPFAVITQRLLPVQQWLKSEGGCLGCWFYYIGPMAKVTSTANFPCQVAHFCPVSRTDVSHYLQSLYHAPALFPYSGQYNQLLY